MKRRALLGLTTGIVGGLAGCLGGDDTGDGSSVSGSVDLEAKAPYVDDDGFPQILDIDWGVDADTPDDPDEYRFWLTMDRSTPGRSMRFTSREGADPSEDDALVPFVDFADHSVNWTLTHHLALIVYGSFDVDDLRATVEASEDHELTGEYGGAPIVDGHTALLPDAIVRSTYGDRYELFVDRHNKEQESLLALDPAFTRLFAELPAGGTVEGEYVAPIADDIGVKEAYVRGIHTDSMESQDVTYVYLFPSESQLTEETLDTLEATKESLITVTDSEIDGQVARIEGEISTR